MDQITTFYVIITIVVVLLLVGLVTSSKLKKELLELKGDNETKVSLLEEYKEKYSQIIDIEAECERIKAQLVSDKEEIEDKSRQELRKLEVKRDEASRERLSIEDQIKNLQSDYKSKKNTYDSLTKQIAIFSEDIELVELGFYEPKFDFDTSEIFKEEIRSCKDRQKALLREKDSSGAIYCSTEWTVSGSKAEGRKMTNKGIRLTARAFNNECDAAIANCTWKNVNKM